MVVGIQYQTLRRLKSCHTVSQTTEVDSSLKHAKALATEELRTCMHKLKFLGSMYSVCVCASVCLYSVHLASTTSTQEIILASIVLAYSYTLFQTHLGFCTIVLCVRTRDQTWKEV